MRIVISALTAAVCLSVSALHGQRQIDPGNLYERVIVVVPIEGSGTYADPRRPLLTQSPAEARIGTDRDAPAFSWQPSDDRKYAIVEFVHRDRKKLEAIARDPRVVKAFFKGREKKEEIEKELKTFRSAPVLRGGVAAGP